MKTTQKVKKNYELREVKTVDEKGNPYQPRIRVIDLKWENEISYENSERKIGYTLDKLFF